ncbi:hypothetical protein [Mesorhizobium caraganae]|uniref:hypothetical protein n=1 Tax=Mesorhizobium caraganae TaxID=483206 RepID=UPI001FE80350|nr:hypothetical protein [Mesorhizobium caraganae]
MGSIKDLNKAIIKEPESAGAKIERKNPSDKDPGGATKLRERRTGRQALLPIRSQTGGAMHGR